MGCGGWHGGRCTEQKVKGTERDPLTYPLRQEQRPLQKYGLFKVPSGCDVQGGNGLQEGVLTANFIASRITWETDLWACLGGSVMTVLIELGRVAHCGWRHSLGGILAWKGAG